MTSSNGNIVRVTGHLCREFTGPRWIPPQRPETRSCDVFFDLRLNKRLSRQWWGCWFETLSRPLWSHRNVLHNIKPEGLCAKMDVLFYVIASYVTLWKHGKYQTKWYLEIIWLRGFVRSYGRTIYNYLAWAAQQSLTKIKRWKRNQIPCFVRCVITHPYRPVSCVLTKIWSQRA